MRIDVSDSIPLNHIDVLPHASRADTMSSAEEPLIANDDASDNHEHNGYASDDDESAPQQKDGDDSAPGLFIWLLAFSAGISGLLFGCKFTVPSCSTPRPTKP